LDHFPIFAYSAPMGRVRINKRQRKKMRQVVLDFIARAESIEATEPEHAAILRRAANSFAKLGKPPKSKARRSKV
jgi:hypothetical protein